jgi:hypothetical protein
MKATVGNVTFTYDKKTRVKIEERHWYDVYHDAILESGEEVEQISLEYNFKKGHCGVFFETKAGDVHSISQETMDFLATRSSK